MKTYVRVTLAAALTTIVVGNLGACSNTKTREERDSLQQQNEQLTAERDAALAQARSEKARADALAAAAARRPAETMPTTPSGLEGVAGVTESKTARGEDQIEIEGDVLFDTGKATIKPAFKKTLDKIAEVMKSKYADRQFRVEGHTDPRPVHTSGWDDNWDLGAARARQVALYLIGRGVPKSAVYIASFADNDLKSTTDYAKDRRVDIVVVK
jgi:flagellar motor protein MotB